MPEPFSKLKCLEITYGSLETVLQVLEACPQLENLNLGGKLISHDLSQLAAFKQVKRLVTASYCPFSLFVDIVELRPDMQLFVVMGCEYAFTPSVEGGVSLLHVTASSPIDVTLLKRIFIACPSAVNLCYGGPSLDANTATVIVEVLGSRLVSLEVTVSDSALPLGIVLQTGGPSLRQLSLQGDLNDVQFIGVIERCPSVQSLTVTGFHQLTPLSLQAIIDHRPPLKTLVLSNTSFKKTDALWFREQAKQHQLLPVPIVTKCLD